MPFSVVRRLWPLSLLLTLLFIFYYFKISQYINFSNLQLHHHQLTSWTEDHYLYAVLFPWVLALALH